MLRLIAGKCRGQTSRYQMRRRDAQAARWLLVEQLTVSTMPCTSSTTSVQSTQRTDVVVATYPGIIDLSAVTAVTVHIASIQPSFLFPAPSALLSGLFVDFLLRRIASGNFEPLPNVMTLLSAEYRVVLSHPQLWGIKNWCSCMNIEFV